MCIGFWGAQENKHDETMQLTENLVQKSCKLFLKFQVGIISLSALYCECMFKMKSPVDLRPLRSISSTKTSDMSEFDPRILKICSKSKALPLEDLSGAVSAYDQNSSDYFYHILLRRGTARLVCHLLCLIPKLWKSLIQRLGLI